MGVIIDDQFSYIDKKEGDSILRIPSYLGAKMLPTESFLGLTLLAFMDPSERKRLLRQHPLKKHTERTVTRLREVEATLDHARQKGYFLERGEFFDGVIQIGVPIRGVAGNTVAASGRMRAGIPCLGREPWKRRYRSSRRRRNLSRESWAFRVIDGGDFIFGTREKSLDRLPKFITMQNRMSHCEMSWIGR